jgi:hypothetical protein
MFALAPDTPHHGCALSPDNARRFGCPIDQFPGDMRVVAAVNRFGSDGYGVKGGGPMISMPPLSFADRMTRSKFTVRSASAISFNATLAPR